MKAHILKQKNLNSLKLPQIRPTICTKTRVVIITRKVKQEKINKSTSHSHHCNSTLHFFTTSSHHFTHKQNFQCYYKKWEWRWPLASWNVNGVIYVKEPLQLTQLYKSCKCMKKFDRSDHLIAYVKIIYWEIQCSIKASMRGRNTCIILPTT